MKIEALTTFLDGRDRFEAGDVRTVSDEDGARFCAAGWAKDISGTVPTGDAATGSADLAIHNATHNVGDSNG
jgi:hypothetical protein